MSFIKLDKPGQRYALKVATVTLDKTGKWPDYHFSDGSVTVVVPKAAADRQITRERMGVDTALDLIGSCIEVSRTEKLAANGNPYWDLALVSVDVVLDQAAPTPSKRIPPPSGAPPQGVTRPFDEPPPPEPGTPYHPEEEAVAAPTADEKRERFIGFYLQVYETMLVAMERTHVESGTPLTADAVQAATATVVIQLDRKGLL